MTRRPIVAGQFYEDGFGELDRQITSCFESKFGPGALPISKRNKEVMAIISPHAGYQFSGPAAAWAFKELAESKFPDLFIMLGLSHAGYPSCLSIEDWETPLGIARTDKRFVEELTKNSALLVMEEAHDNEHSIEVQLPFLQFINKEHLNKIRICPIIASDDMQPKVLAASIVKTIKQLNKRVQIITSSDFTHYGVNYGYFPFSDNIKKRMYELDKQAIDLILQLDAEQFTQFVVKNKATICGRTPITVLMEMCRLLNAKKAKLLHYYTSGDIINNYSSAVGYAAISIE